MCTRITVHYTMKPLLKDTPEYRVHWNHLPAKDTSRQQNWTFLTVVGKIPSDFLSQQQLDTLQSKIPIVLDIPVVLPHIPPLKSGQPLYNEQISWSQCVLYEEVPLCHNPMHVILLLLYSICIVYRTTKVQRSFLLCFFTSAIGGVGG